MTQEVYMQSIIRTWGNSQGLYIPKKLLKEASLSVNDPVELSVIDGVLTIRKSTSNDMKVNALASLREIRNSHKDAAGNISEDYREERNKYLDEKYGR